MSQDQQKGFPPGLAPVSSTAPGPFFDKTVEYEYRKRAWIESHPGAPYDAYQRAVREIAEELKF